METKASPQDSYQIKYLTIVSCVYSLSLVPHLSAPRRINSKGLELNVLLDTAYTNLLLVRVCLGANDYSWLSPYSVCLVGQKLISGLLKSGVSSKYTATVRVSRRRALGV